MPLHAQYSLMLVALYCLNHFIGRHSRYTQMFAYLVHSLMVERVDKHYVVRIYISKQATLLYVYAVSRFLAVGILRMFNPVIGHKQILLDMSVKSNGKSLHTTANAQYRQLSMICISCNHKFGQVAFSIYMMQSWCGLVAVPQRVEIGTSGKQQSIYLVECRQYNVVIFYGWNKQRSASRLHYLSIVSRSQCGIYALIICSYAHNRAIWNAWSIAVKFVEMFV